MQRTAVVTGGAGGIGGAIVRSLGEAGHEVAILDREDEFAVDLADEQAVRRASKARLVGIARTLARPLGAHGITVNCVAPGLTRTRFTEADLPEEAFREVLVRQALPRSLMPGDVAASWRFSPPMPPRRSRGRRCAPTAARCSPDLRVGHGIG